MTVMNSGAMKGLREVEREERKSTLVDARGRELQCVGLVRVPMKRGKRTVMARVCVIEEAPQNLLGAPEIKALNLLMRVNALRVEDKFTEVYGGLGQLPESFEIKLKEKAIPYLLPVPRRLPIVLREATEKDLRRMEETGVIERVEGPREWCAWMVVAPKASGGVRICVDLTVLNKSVKRENYPLPRVEDTLELLEGSTVFSKMDANFGFWHIELEEGSRPYTTFITPFGRFQCKKMPFGISAAPEFFQRQMSKVLVGLAIMWACEKFDFYLMGADFEVGNGPQAIGEAARG